VSSWSSSSVLVNRAAERQGHAVEAAITVMVFGPFSRPDVAAVYCRRPGFSSHCGTSLERSARGRYLIDYSASFQATAQD